MDEFSNGKDIYNAVKKNAAYRNEPVRANPPNTERRANPPSQEVANPPNEALQALTDALLKAPDISVVAVRLEDDPLWLNREQIKQEIRELDAIRLASINPEMDEVVYHRINELLDMLNEFD